jgi:tRNA (mo5U34)-methyltransferase
MLLRPKAGLSEHDIRAIVESHDWYQRIEILPGFFTPGVTDVSHHIATLHLPEDCTGLRALDIGPADGFYSFLLEQRGATVVAVEKEPRKSFYALRELTGCATELRIDNVYNISFSKYGLFDLVLFLGVLYHLRNPLLALDRLREVCSRKIFVESHVDIEGPSSELPLARFYPTSEQGKDYTNWWGPNVLCLAKMVESARFNVTHVHTTGSRAVCIGVPSQDRELEYFVKYDYKFL